MEARSAWCALEGRIIRRVVPLVYSFVCFVSSILLSLSLSLHRLSVLHLLDCEAPERPSGVLPANPPPRPLAYVRAPKVQR